MTNKAKARGSAFTQMRTCRFATIAGAGACANTPGVAAPVEEARHGRRYTVSHPPKPCNYCGGVKPPGRGRKACDQCMALAPERRLEADRIRNRANGRYANADPSELLRRSHKHAPAGMKWCAQCRQYRPVAEFGANRTDKGHRAKNGHGLAAYCKSCASAYQHAYSGRQFGITAEEYRARFTAQGGRCAICSQPPEPRRRLAVDHDHQTGRVRGLLCRRCNQSIIGASGDDPALLRRAADYLEAE